MSLAGRAALVGLKARYRDGLVPAGVMLALRSVLPGSDPLEPDLAHPPKTGRDIRDPTLAALIGSQEIGTWSLGPATLDFLAAEVRRSRPARVLEFGSGVSTVCLAKLLADLDGTVPAPRLVAMEQDRSYAAQTTEWLRTRGLDSIARVTYAPLEQGTVEGRPTASYTIPDDVRRIFQQVAAEMLLIDGPAAEPGGRFATLPVARQLAAPRAAFILDDALRDGELSCLRLWRGLPYVAVHGIRLIEKGLLLGSLSGLGASSEDPAVRS